MVLWKTNQFTKDKTMVLWIKNYGTIPKISELRFYEGENMVDYKYYETVIFNGKKYGNIPKQLQFLNKFIALEL